MTEIPTVVACKRALKGIITFATTCLHIIESYCKPVIIPTAVSSHHVRIMFPVFSDNVSIIFPSCSHHVTMIFHHVPTVFPSCSHHVPIVFPRFSHQFPIISIISHDFSICFQGSRWSSSRFDSGIPRYLDIIEWLVRSGADAGQRTPSSSQGPGEVGVPPIPMVI